MQSKQDLDKLIAVLPLFIQETIANHTEQESLIEVVLDLGRLPEARFSFGTEYLSDRTIDRDDIDYCVSQLGIFGGDNRAGIESTLHRISAIKNRKGDIIGLTCRIGKAVSGSISIIQELLQTDKSILLLGRPGVGKTTVLREIAKSLAETKRVVIVDTSNEIGGDGDIPHSAIGKARRLQVAHPELQHRIMIEAVENHTPQVIVIDEIGTELEAIAARTIAERGVQLVGTAHGNFLDNLIKNPTLSNLIGGIQSVTLGDEEARFRGTQKTVLEREAPPTFDIAIEMWERQKWAVHIDVSSAVDNLLKGQKVYPEIREVGQQGEVLVSSRQPSVESFDELLRKSPLAIVPNVLPRSQANQDLRINVYPYGIDRKFLKSLISSKGFPIYVVNSLESADAVLIVKGANNPKCLNAAKNHKLPIFPIKSSNHEHLSSGLGSILSAFSEQAIAV